MAQMKRETLVQKMMQDPDAVREFLNRFSDQKLAELFPDHDIKVKMKEVRNLMSGKMVSIPANTPHHCDPSTESYWSS